MPATTLFVQRHTHHSSHSRDPNPTRRLFQNLVHTLEDADLGLLQKATNAEKKMRRRAVYTSRRFVV